MTFKPMTYLVSFTLFVMLFMALGIYVGYAKFSDLFLTRAYLDATSISAHVLANQEGNLLQWDDRIPLQHGAFARITASNRSLPIAIHYSDESAAVLQPTSGASGIPLAANERTEDIRVDKAGHYLYVRVLATSRAKFEETTWLYRYDLQGRRMSRRSSVNPVLLPVPFRP
jgi:hypothetical protein